VGADGTLTYKFYNYSRDVIPKELIACKYFDMDFVADVFTPNGDLSLWRDIPTPHFDKITKFQFDVHKKHKDDVYDFLCVLLGRLPAPLRKWDKWEIYPFIVGLAGCGKSMLLLEVVAKFFEDIDIGFLQDTNEGKFAYGPLKDKKVLIGTEVKKTFNTPAPLFQQLVSGEYVTLAIKNGDPAEVQWTAPMILAGNELFGLADKGGSIARRTVKFSFYRKVREEDKIMNMDELLSKNMGNILHKMTCAYLEKINQIKKRSIWMNISKYFIEQREKVTQETNPFYNYLSQQSIVTFGKGLFIDFATLKLSYKNFCKINNILVVGQVIEDTYLAPFADISFKVGHDIYVEKNTKRKQMDEDGNLVEDERPRDYVIGLSLIE
jgi:hypothetical protein